MEINNYMTKYIITASISSDIYDLAKLMKEYDIGFIPITENKKIIGVMTDRDIVVGPISNKDNKIKDYITKNIISINEKQKINDALNLMRENKVKRLLVVDDNNIVKGIISLSDIIKKASAKDVYDATIEIYEINRNIEEKNVEIDSFYL